MRRLAVLGASGHGRVVAEAALSAGWEAVSFFDDGFPDKTSFDKFTIEGDLDKLLEKSNSYDGFHVAIGHNRTRLKILAHFLELDFPCPNIISPSSVISQSASLGAGISIMANVVVNANCMLGDGVILNTCCSVDHDCNIASGVHISPGAHLAGDVSVGICSWVGIGSVIIQGKMIGDDSIVGAGSTVISDIPSCVTAAGVPSKIIK